MQVLDACMTCDICPYPWRFGGDQRAFPCAMTLGVLFVCLPLFPLTFIICVPYIFSEGEVTFPVSLLLAISSLSVVFQQSARAHTHVVLHLYQ